ncbi:MAG: TIGR03564 family F420-dependent LLM class oxidoreductase [Acidimicrobiales bacterium]
MRIGLSAPAATDLARVVAGVERAETEGFSSYWLPQIFGVDALTALAVAGAATEHIEVGTAVVPIHPRHPLMLAAQALTVQAACGGRLALGVGLSHRVVTEEMWGISWDRPLRRMSEYLSALIPALAGRSADVDGELLTAHGAVDVADTSAPPVLVAALGPQMLELTGRVADGTITWCVGPRTLANHTVPTIRAAAEAAGRVTPRVVAAFPVAVTDDVPATRAALGKRLAVYGGLPSYRTMLDAEGVDAPEDLAIVGDADEVARRVGELAGIGVTDFALAEAAITSDERRRTRETVLALSA